MSSRDGLGSSCGITFIVAAYFQVMADHLATSALPSLGHIVCCLAMSEMGHKRTWLERQASFAGDVSAFLGDGAFHQRHHEHKRKRHHGENPEAVEIGKGGGLLLA